MRPGLLKDFLEISSSRQRGYCSSQGLPAPNCVVAVWQPPLLRYDRSLFLVGDCFALSCSQRHDGVLLQENSIAANRSAPSVGQVGNLPARIIQSQMSF